MISQRVGQKEGAERLDITVRHLRRLCEELRKDGPRSVISKKRGKPSHRRLGDEVRTAVIELIRDLYPDFGPSLAHEKLVELHGLTIGLESVRQLMIRSGLWQGRSRRRIKAHQMRTRRPCRGELIQIDGSPHDWFEGRAERCCLLVAIDDATGEVMGARFVELESTAGYFDLMQEYLSRHGRPQALYSDKHSIFRVNIKEAESGTGETQFGRALRELGIDLICANTPQAKGRVERMNKTLQDRLVKEMRLQGVSGINAGNAFLPGFLEQLNRKYTVRPASAVDLHRLELPTEDALNLIFSVQSVRKLSKSLELQYQNVVYQVQTSTPSYAMRKASVAVCERKGKVTLLYKGKALDYKTLDRHNQPQETLASKDLDHHFDRRSLGHKPKAEHPWRARRAEATYTQGPQPVPPNLHGQTDCGLVHKRPLLPL